MNHDPATIDGAAWGLRLEQAHGLEAGDINSRHKDRYLMPIRAILANALRLRGYSTTEIGRAMGGRNHTSIMRILEAWPLERARAEAASTAYGSRPATVGVVEAVLAEAREAVAADRRMTVAEQRAALPPITVVAEGRTLRLRAGDPEAAAFGEVVERLRKAKRRDRRTIWEAYCRVAYPLTAAHQALVMPVGIAG